MLFFSLVQPPPATAISPETYNVSLRNTDTLSLPIDVTTVRNIPLDLYILFDVSQSMDEEISAIQGASAEISEPSLNIDFPLAFFVVLCVHNYNGH